MLRNRKPNSPKGNVKKTYPFVLLYIVAVLFAFIAGFYFGFCTCTTSTPTSVLVRSACLPTIDDVFIKMRKYVNIFRETSFFATSVRSPNDTSSPPLNFADSKPVKDLPPHRGVTKKEYAASYETIPRLLRDEGTLVPSGGWLPQNKKKTAGRSGPLFKIVMP